MERELLQLEDHYTQLIDQANQFGLDTTAIQQQYEAEKTRILAEAAGKRQEAGRKGNKSGPKESTGKG